LKSNLELLYVEAAAERGVAEAKSPVDVIEVAGRQF
jgi:hypothetical protein